MQPQPSDMKAALVVAHPSHEVRVFGWLELTRPRVSVITDGSGGDSSASQIPSAKKLLTTVGAEQGPIFGRMTDLKLYSAILDNNVDLFVGLADELSESFISMRVDRVVGDAAEGFSPAHDICRLLINAAVQIVDLTYGHKISNYQFDLFAAPEEYVDVDGDEATWVHLDDDMFARKIAAARGYSPQLAADIDAALNGGGYYGLKPGPTIRTLLNSHAELKTLHKDVFRGVGMDAFRVECLRPVNDQTHNYAFGENRRAYEVYGEQLVAEGRYDRAIRYEEHVRPIETALSEYAAGRASKAVAYSYNQ